MNRASQQWLEDTEPRIQLMLLGGVLVLLVAVFLSYLVWPQYQQVKQVGGSLQVLKQAGQGGAELQQQLNRMTDEVAGLSQKLHGDMADLPPEQMEAYIVGRLQRVSWDSGVDLISVRPAEGKQVQRFSESVFNVQIHARYADIFRWLQRMNREVGFIVVKQYHIKPIGENWSDPALDVSLSMAAYRMVRS